MILSLTVAWHFEVFNLINLKLWKVRSGGGGGRGEGSGGDDDDNDYHDSDCDDIKIWGIKDILCITLSKYLVIPHQEGEIY